MQEKSNKSSLEKEVEELKDSYLRSRADYENLLKRTQDDKERMIKMANEDLIGKVLGILNDLEEANSHLNDEGLAKIIEKFYILLANEGLEEINPVDAKFDPSLHEALESISGEANKIVRVIQKGYQLHNKVVKPALVAVGNGQ